MADTPFRRSKLDSKLTTDRSSSLISKNHAKNKSITREIVIKT